jgi:hypothetical protein
MYNIKPENLKYDPSFDSLSDLNFIQNDGSDPLLVKQYAKNHFKRIENTENVKTYLVKYQEKIISFTDPFYFINELE